MSVHKKIYYNQRRITINSFFAILKTQTIASLQFRVSAFAKISTHIFWGVIQVCMMFIFYTYGEKSDGGAGAGMTMSQAISYAWLVQASVSLMPNIVDNSVWEKIKSGDVGTELCRPLNLYANWLAQTISKRLAPFLITVIPIIVLASVMPKPYNLLPPESLLGLGAAVVSLSLGIFLSSALSAFTYPMLANLKWGNGPAYMYLVVLDVFSGSYFPLQLWPDWAKKFIFLLPTAGVTDLPFRFYIGIVPPEQLFVNIIFQIVWIVILVAAGSIWLGKAVKKIAVQGG